MPALGATRPRGAAARPPWTLVGSSSVVGRSTTATGGAAATGGTGSNA